MKQLQHNFTTPEQSKRLLELELPESSADLRQVRIKNHDIWHRPYLVQTGCKYHGANCMEAVPCWSVGRLIEIITICDTEEEWEPTFEPDDNILEMVFDFISENHNNRLDFSKLED